MADAQIGESRQFDLDSTGSTDLVEGSALAVKSATGAITVDGFTETGTNALVSLAITGGTPHDSVDSGNPVKVGGKASTSAPTAVAVNDRVNAWYDTFGIAQVSLRDTAGAAITTGIQYIENAAITADLGQGTLVIGRRDDALSTLTPVEGDAIGLRVNSVGALWVGIAGTDGTPLLVNETGAIVVSALGYFSVEGGNLHDAALDAPTTRPVLVGGYAKAAAPTDVSADGDAVLAWYLRNGAQATVLTAAGALIGGDATNGLDVDVTRLPALVAGTANIGDVDVLTVPADPFGANADAQSASGSISAKLRFIATTGIPITGTVTVGSHAVTNAGTFAVQAAGGTAADAAIAANPVTIGARGSTALPNAMSADGDVVNLWASLNGALNVTLRDTSGAEVVPIVTQYIGDAAATSTPTGVVSMGRANSAAPADVSANNDAVAAWFLRNGAQATVITAAGALVGGDAANGLDVDVTRLPALVAGNANIGDVDIVTVPAPLSTTGNGTAATALRVTIASDTTGVLAITDNAGSLTVDNGGTFAVQPAGSVAHDGAAAAVNPNLMGAYASAAVPSDVSADNDAVRVWALRNGSQVVNIASGGTLWTNMGQAAASGQFVRLTDGTLTASVRDTGASDSLNVAIVDGSGNQITTFGGGTQYVGDAAATATPTGTVAMGLANAAAPSDVSANNDAVAAWYLRNGSQATVITAAGALIGGDATGGLHVQGAIAHDGVDSGSPVKIGGYASTTAPTAVAAADRVNGWFSLAGAMQVGLGPVTTVGDAWINTAILTPRAQDGTASALFVANTLFNGATWDRMRGDITNGLDVDVTRLPALVAGTANIGDVDVLTVPAPLSTTGGGTEAAALRVTIATDSTGVLSVDDNGGSLTVDGTVAVTGVATAANQTSVQVVDNAAFTDGTTTVMMPGYVFDDVAGTALTENDAAAARIDSKRAQVIVGEDATTRGQKWAISSAGALAANITQVGGATISATVPMSNRLTDGTAYYTKTGQLVSTAAFAQLSDQTTAVGVIAGTTALKTDLSSVAGTATVTGGIAGVQSIGGPTAADAAIAAQPVTIGARGSTALPTAMSADGDVTNLWASLNGALNVILRDTAGTYVVPGGGTQYVGDAAATATPTGTISMGLAHAAAPSDVSADNDAVALWALRNGSLVVNLAAGGTLLTNMGQAVASANFSKLTDGTLTVGAVDETGASAVDALAIGGGTPHDSVDSGNPLKIGGKYTLTPTAVADGDRVNARFDEMGALMSGTGPGFNRFAAQQSATGTGAMTAVNAQGAQMMAVYVSGTFSVPALLFQGTVDGTNWVNAHFKLSTALGWNIGTNVTPTTGTMLYVLVEGFRQLRAFVTTYTSGTILLDFSLIAGVPHGLPVTLLDANGAVLNLTGTVNQADATVASSGLYVINQGSVYNGATWDRQRGAVGVTGSTSVGGPTAADAAIAAAPITIGARGSTALPTAMSADGDVTNLWASLNGALNVIVRDTAGAAVSVGYVGDAAATATPTGTMQMGLAHAAAPSDVSADNDAVAAWYLRNGAAATVLTAAGALIGGGTPQDGVSLSSVALKVNAYSSAFNGSTLDLLRTTPALDASPNVDTGILAVGVGPGYDRKRDPVGVAATSTANAVTVVVDGADAILFHVTTIGVTPGSMILEQTGDDGAWTTCGAVIKLGALDTWIEGSFVPAVNDQYMVRTTGVRQVRYRVNATYASGTATVKWTAVSGSPIIKTVEMPGAPHKIGYALTGISAQYTSAQTSTTIGPTVSSTQRMVVTYLQIQCGGTVAATQCSIYFGTSTFSRGTSKTIFDGEFAPSATNKPGVIAAPPIPWMGAADEELKITSVGTANPLTVTIWYYLVAA